jgi:hypothetical protein
MVTLQISLHFFESYITVSGLAKVAIFSIPIAIGIDAESARWRMINHQPRLICGALNRHYCQTRVIGSPFLSVC